MTHAFDKKFWEQHWQQAPGAGSDASPDDAPNPYLAAETGELLPGTALDAGCGHGAEALWLASHGWHVTAVDIASEALARVAGRAAAGGVSGSVEWVEADLTVWAPGDRFDLVTTHYAHPTMPQLAFYDRISEWVAPGGTLLVVGHLHTAERAGHGQHPPAEASITPSDIAARLDNSRWEIVTATQHARTLTDHAGHTIALHDVVVRATRAR